MSKKPESKYAKPREPERGRGSKDDKKAEKKPDKKEDKRPDRKDDRKTDKRADKRDDKRKGRPKERETRSSEEQYEPAESEYHRDYGMPSRKLLGSRTRPGS